MIIVFRIAVCWVLAVASLGYTVSGGNERLLPCVGGYDSAVGYYVYTHVDTMPTYGDDYTGVARFFYNHINMDNPDCLIFTVRMSFVVQMDGTLADVTICCDGCTSEELTCTESEIVRVLNLMGKWNPGKCGDSLVPVRVHQLFNISVEE